MDIPHFREAAVKTFEDLQESPDVGDVVRQVADLSRTQIRYAIQSLSGEVRRLLSFGIDVFLRSLPEITRMLLDMDDAESVPLQAEIRAWIEKNVLTNTRVLFTDSNAQNSLRYRNLLQLWISPTEYRDMLVHSMKYYIDKKTLGPLNDSSLFLAMEYPVLKAAYPSDIELQECIITLANHFDRWIALYAYQPPEKNDAVQTSREFPGDDDILRSSDIISSKRVEHGARSTVCCPQAEAGHLATSLSNQRGNNTFVYVKGKLIGSVKHNDDSDSRYTLQNSFLGMRTVQAPDGTYPVIEGGLYLVADCKTLQMIKSSGDRCDLPSLTLMPQRSAHTNFVPSENFATRTRALRAALEKGA